MQKTIESYNSIVFKENLNDIVLKIKANNITDRTRSKKHIKNINNKINEDAEKVDNMICPRCGNKLVLRKSEYGQFLGCTNYPKCRYTNNQL